MIPITPAQIEQAAKEYCRIRHEQDGIPRFYLEQIEVAQVMSAWYIAFKSVLEPYGETGETPTKLVVVVNTESPTV